MFFALYGALKLNLKKPFDRNLCSKKYYFVCSQLTKLKLLVKSVILLIKCFFKKCLFGKIVLHQGICDLLRHLFDPYAVRYCHTISKAPRFKHTENIITPGNTLPWCAQTYTVCDRHQWTPRVSPRPSCCQWIVPQVSHLHSVLCTFKTQTLHRVK